MTIANIITTRKAAALWLILGFIRTASAATPQDSVDYKRADLVEIVKLDSTIKLDIRYATTHNFTGVAVYPEARAFLQREAALALVDANKRLKALGYGIVVYDGYRPWSITQKFWDVTPADKKAFVANPAKGSRHNRGCAVDVGLYSLKSGAPVEMISEYDEMSERSAAGYTGGTEMQRNLRDMLRTTMFEVGFTGISSEWWHFDFKGWQRYRICNIPFSSI